MSPIVDQNHDISSSVHSIKSDTNVLNLDQERSPYNSPPPVDNFSNLKDSILVAGNRNEVAVATVAEKNEHIVAKNGFLDDKLMQHGLCNIGKMADGYNFVFLDLYLPAMEIKNIETLQVMTNLQNVNLMHNKVSDLSPLNSLSYLLSLNVSNNVIQSLDSLAGLKNLRNLDASNNVLACIGDMSRFPALENLNLNNNQIARIEGLEHNTRLKVLDLSANQLTSLEICKTGILELYLSANKIASLESIQNLESLQALDISYNALANLKGLENRRYLMKIDAQNNNIVDYDDLEPVFIGNRLLRELNLRNNPIQDKDDYRFAILYRCSELTSLDKHKVQPEEKVSAMNLFNPPPEVVAARDHINHVVYKYLQPAKLRECTLPSLETPYPILVLSGPQGCGKIELAARLAQEFPDFFGYLPNQVLSMTNDNSVYGQELQQNSHPGISADEFVNMIQEGRFVSTYSDGFRTLGIMYDAIDSIASEGLACVTHMEYEGILSFKKSFFEPRYLLLIPKTEEVHEERLKTYYQMSDEEVRSALLRRDVYMKINQENPGFFDQVIDADDIEEALQSLTSIVKEYLGLPPDYVASRELSSGPGRDFTKRNSLGGTNVVSNVLRYKVSGGKNQSGRQVSIREGMTETELRSYERRESALREGIRENDLSPESAYGGTNTIYGKPYTAPAAFEGNLGHNRDFPTSNDGDEQNEFNEATNGDRDEQREDEDYEADESNTPIERPELGNHSKERLQERASALLDDEALLENEVQVLFGKAGKSVEGNIENLHEAKNLIKSYFESNLFEFRFAEEDNKKFEVSFQSYAETDGQLDMTFDEFKGWFVYMLRMIKYGLYADNN